VEVGHAGEILAVETPLVELKGEIHVLAAPARTVERWALVEAHPRRERLAAEEAVLRPGHPEAVAVVAHPAFREAREMGRRLLAPLRLAVAVGADRRHPRLARLQMPEHRHR
jgi:hypothetical protein